MSTLARDVRSNGSVSNQVNLTAFAVLALRAADVALPPGMLALAGPPAGLATAASTSRRAVALSDVDDTGAVLEALAGADGTGSAHARARAIGYLRGQQDGDGGFPAMPGAGSNAQSTAFAVQGLVAAGVDPGSLRRRGASPLDYLRGLIAPDGHVRYSRGVDQTPTWVTAEALMALDGRAAAARSRWRAGPRRRATHGPQRSTPRHAAAPATAAPAPRHRASPRRAAAPARPSVAAPASSDPNLDRLAAYAGIVTALSLAPLG